MSLDAVATGSVEQAVIGFSGSSASRGPIGWSGAADLSPGGA